MEKKHRQMIVCIVALLALLAARAVSGFISDLAGHWSAPLVAALAAKGIIGGDEEGRFQPDAPLTRAQAAKILVLALGSGADAALLTQYDSRFDDLPRTHWAKGYVESLAELAVAEGYPDGNFRPNETVTRAQMALFLVRAAGLTDQARLKRLEPTIFADDAALPDWARGAINIAISSGMLNGFEDGFFRPNQPVTRAEGGTATFRLMAFKGAAYHLSGTLIQFDPAALSGVVRDAVGEERRFTLSSTSQIYRAGQQVPPQQLRRLDQVWVALGEDGKGIFLEARYRDLLGKSLRVTGETLVMTLPSGEERTMMLQPGALLFLNGRQASVSELHGADEGYVALDVLTGQVRLLDGVKVSVSGLLTDVASSTIYVHGEGQIRSFRAAPGALLFLNGQRVSLSDLVEGDRVRLALNREGLITYLQVER